MKLLIEVDKKYRRLFLETAKAVHAKVQEVDDFYMTEEQEDAAILKLIEEGRKEGRMNKEEQKEFRDWIRKEAQKANKLVTA
jgi:Arc/MetJ-type ribon-helix-helix transcriptional regulator